MSLHQKISSLRKSAETGCTSIMVRISVVILQKAPSGRPNGGTWWWFPTVAMTPQEVKWGGVLSGCWPSRRRSLVSGSGTPIILFSFWRWFCSGRATCLEYKPSNNGSRSTYKSGRWISIVARNCIFTLIWRCYGPKRDILEYWGTILYDLISYYVLSKYKGL